jgi:hypothetical protein
MKRIWAVLAAGAVLGAALGVAPGGRDAGAEADTDFDPTRAYNLFSLKYSDDIIACDSNIYDECFPITYDQWAALGFAMPIPSRLVSTSYVKYSWSPVIYARSNMWAWGSYTDPIEGREWARAGYPTPAVNVTGPHTEVYWWHGSEEIFLAEVDGPGHRLTYSEWVSLGHPWPVRQENRGFFKLSWSNEIAYLWDFAGGQGAPIELADWAFEGYPTPVVAPRIAGDRVYKYADSDVVSYAGPTLQREITLGEWAAMGYPTPEVTG